MNTKILVPTLGALLLCSSTLALADDWHARDHGPAQYQGWGDSRAERHWHEFQQYRAWRQHYWCARPPHGHWKPAPGWQHDQFSYPTYDRDGVTIIFRGRVN